jgi:hypothetical protein
MSTTPDALTRQAVHTALVELLTTGQHHHAVTPATLAAVGDTRRTLAAEHGSHDPARAGAGDEHRLAALTNSLGQIGSALFYASSLGEWPDPVRLYSALAELAAVALGWLDALPDPPAEPGDHQGDQGEEAPF